MEFLSASDESIKKAAAVLVKGCLAAFPTETVYGLGADAFNPAALAKVFAAKNRPRFDPLIVHIADSNDLEKIADPNLLDRRVRKQLAALVEKFWPGPLTLILPKQKTVPDLATSGLSTVAVRFPNHPVAQKLIALSTGAVAAPSANPFGYLSPTTADHVRVMLDGKVDVILDGGPTTLGLESTVLDICCQPPRILRPGGAPPEAIEALIGKIDLYANADDKRGAAAAGESEGGLKSPGLLKSHYAPHTPLVIFSPGEPGQSAAGVAGISAFLFFDGPGRNAWLLEQNVGSGPPPAALIKTLSEEGNDVEAAANLFSMLHELDNQKIDRIYAQLAPERGLGLAINDRLRRASIGTL